MSTMFTRSFVFMLATVAVVPVVSVRAQEEPIAVAAPAKDAPKETAKAEAPVDAAKGAVKADADKRVRPLTVSVQLLRSDLVLTGALTDSTLMAIKTAFGEASIPLSEVAGVRFPSGQDTSTTLVMLNGDSITGASDVKAVTVETEWGSAKINGENISSMMFVPGLEWQNTKGLNGARWTLIEAKAKPTGPAPTPGTSGAANQVPGMPVTNPANQPGAASPNNTPRVVFPR